LVLRRLLLPQGSERTTFEDIMSIVLEIMNSILSTNLHNNSQLVYAVLLRRDLFTQHRSNPRFADLVENINMVCSLTQWHWQTKAQLSPFVVADLQLFPVQDRRCQSQSHLR
jgi:hypothetical protein